MRLRIDIVHSLSGRQTFPCRDTHSAPVTSRSPVTFGPPARVTDTPRKLIFKSSQSLSFIEVVLTAGVPVLYQRQHYHNLSFQHRAHWRAPADGMWTLFTGQIPTSLLQVLMRDGILTSICLSNDAGITSSLILASGCTRDAISAILALNTTAY